MSGVATEVETLHYEELGCLTENDRAWLLELGMDPIWLDDDDRHEQLEQLIAVGNEFPGRTRPVTEVVEARASFLHIIGVGSENIGKLTQAYSKGRGIVPTITTIGTLRLLHEQGFHLPIALETNVFLLQKSAQSIEARITGLEEAGLTIESMRAWPKFLTVSPENLTATRQFFETNSIPFPRPDKHLIEILQTPVEELKLRVNILSEAGVDALRALRSEPRLIAIGTEKLRQKCAYFIGKGFNLSRLVATDSSVLLHDLDTIDNKLAALEDEGLDSTKIVQVWPKILHNATETVQKRMRLLRRSGRVLQWEGSVEELVEQMPNLLCFSTKKLILLRRLMAEYADVDRRSATSGQIKTYAIIPLDYYIAALEGISLQSDPQSDEDSDIITYTRRLQGSVTNKSMPRRDRVIARTNEAARVLATYRTRLGLGRIATMYHQYKNSDNN